MPPVPDYSCSQRPWPGVMLAKPCFMPALWYSALLARPGNGMLPDLVSHLSGEHGLVLLPALMAGWASALAEKPGERQCPPHAHTHPSKGLPTCPGAAHSQHGRRQCQEVFVGAGHAGRAASRTPSAGAGICLRGQDAKWDVMGPPFTGMGSTEGLPALQGSLHHMR